MNFDKTFSVLVLLGCLAVFLASSPVYSTDPDQYDENGNTIFDTHIDVNDGHSIIVKQGKDVNIKAELWGINRYNKVTYEKRNQDIYYELYDSSGNLVNQTNYNTNCFGLATTNWIGNAHFTLKTNTLPVNTYTLYIWFNGETKDKEALYPCSKEVQVKVIPNN